MCYQPLRSNATRVLKIVTMRVTPVVSVRGTDKPWRSCTGMVSAFCILSWTSRDRHAAGVFKDQTLPSAFKFCWAHASSVRGTRTLGNRTRHTLAWNLRKGLERTVGLKCAKVYLCPSLRDSFSFVLDAPR